MDMGRPKANDYPPYMTRDKRRGGYVVRNPFNRKAKRFGPGQEREAREAAGLLGQWAEKERQARMLDAGRATIAAVIDRFMSDRVRFMPWDEGTRRAIGYKLARIREELGGRLIERTDRLFLAEWLAFCKTADQHNKWRYVLVLLWRFAISRKDCEVNEPEAILERSTSKKLDENKKVRQPLDVEGFSAAHAQADGWLQIAMEQSLVTLLARTEICSIRHEHYRGGYLYVIRDKTAGDSDMAFIRIALTPQLEEIQRRARRSGIASPYLVHRKAERARRDWIDDKPHWSCVEPIYLSRAFATARDKSGAYDELDTPRRPTFHEVRGLGSRILKARGIPAADIQRLMTHSDPATTRIYLDGGAAALRDDQYVAVQAPLTVAEMLKG